MKRKREDNDGSKSSAPAACRNELIEDLAMLIVADHRRRMRGESVLDPPVNDANQRSTTPIPPTSIDVDFASSFDEEA